MPKISRFLGIVIMMNYNEHEPPHFHARYGRSRVSVRISDGVITGSLPPRTLTHILEWAENWQLARKHLPLKQIEPLE